MLKMVIHTHMFHCGRCSCIPSLIKSLFLILQFSVLALGQVQSFSIEPEDTTVIQGQSAVLRCAVEYVGGTLAWKKDGIILGTQRDLPGYSRYSIIGDLGTSGNLQIERAELSDDATYVCIILATASHQQLTSRPAVLTIQVPPDAPTIDNHGNGSLVSIKPPGEVTLTCRSGNGKPAPSVSWMKNNEPLLYKDPTQVEEIAGDSSGKLINIASTILLQPDKEDNGLLFTCKIEHPALPEPLMVSVQMNVLFPPSAPLINGYTEGTIVRTGDELRLECLSRGGNPLAEVYWYKNGERMDYSYVTDGVSARNVLPLVVGYGDNNAVYRCEATSVVLEAAMTTEIRLTVLFAPAFVNVTGAENMVHSGTTLTLSCTSGFSNPASFITWWSAGRQLQTHQDVVTEAPNGGFITQQNLTITMIGERDTVDYMCQATNQELLETVDQTVTVSVMYPPTEPIITGYGEGSEVKAGNILRLQCYANGGNPLATLKWLKNGVVQEAEQSTSSRVASSELTIILDQTDNRATYACNASNEATPQPLQVRKILNVLFPPSTVTVTAEPAVTKEGESVSIRCATASSNPQSEISWWRDGIPFGDDSTQEVVHAENGGRSTRSELVVETLTWENNGGVYLCRAMNDLLVESVNDGLTLDVRYAPKITTETGTSVTRREVPGLTVLNCTTHANPSTITYVWSKDGTKVTPTEDNTYAVHDNGSLTIQDAARAQAGVYSCSATNEEGSSAIEATLNIEYSPTITTGDSITIQLYTAAEVTCEVDANPKPEGCITWSRVGFDISQHTQEFRDGTGVLRFANVSKTDSGMYTCHADNGIEPTVEKDISVVVQYKPEIDQSVAAKVARAPGKTSVLQCRAEGAPVVKFKWMKDQEEVNKTNPRYTLHTRKDLRFTNLYEGRLVISHLDISDYGTYVCEAFNDFGTAYFQIVLEKTSVPQAPTNLMIVSFTQMSVTLNWTAGFDGGKPQRFQIRFNQHHAKQYQYVDVVPDDATIFTVENLRPNTLYFFTVNAKNEDGEGPYFTGSVSAKTKKAPLIPTGPPHPVFNILPLYGIILVSFIFVMGCIFLNLYLCCCLIKKRTRKTGDAGTEKPGIELVKPASEGDSHSLPGSISHADSERDRDSYDASDYSQRSADRYYSDDPSHSYQRHYDDDHYDDDQYSGDHYDDRYDNHSYPDDRSYRDDGSYRDDRSYYDQTYRDDHSYENRSFNDDYSYETGPYTDDGYGTRRHDEETLSKRGTTPSQRRLSQEPSTAFPDTGYPPKDSFDPNWDSNYVPLLENSPSWERKDENEFKSTPPESQSDRYPESASPAPSSVATVIPQYNTYEPSIIGSQKGYLV